MPVKGTRNLFGNEAVAFTNAVNAIRLSVQEKGYMPYYPSSLADPAVFVDKAGPEILDQMYVFKDKGDRDVCLIPEVTAIVQSEYKESWSKSLPRPVKLHYLSRCYRYERPQAGRYREFWQFGLEHLGDTRGGTKDDMIDLLKSAIDATGLKDYKISSNVKRGLNYYIEDGFEVECECLGAQKQIAGGGRYDCGIGWAIGVDRLLLALEQQ